ALPLGRCGQPYRFTAVASVPPHTRCARRPRPVDTPLLGWRPRAGMERRAMQDGTVAPARMPWRLLAVAASALALAACGSAASTTSTTSPAAHTAGAADTRANG